MKPYADKQWETSQVWSNFFKENLTKPENVDRVPVEEWAGDLEEVARLRTFFSGAEAKASLNRAFKFL